MTGRAALDPAVLTDVAALGLGDRPADRLEELVAEQLGGSAVRLRSVLVREHPYDRPVLTTSRRHLVSGVATDGTGRTRDHSFFVKVVRAWSRSPLSAEVPEPLRSQLAPLLPWRTEPDLYRGDLACRLPPGLRLAHAYAVVDLDDGSTAVWLENVPVRRVPWDVARHRHAAYLLGRLAAGRSVAPLAAAAPVGRTARRYTEHWLAVNVVPDLVSGDAWRQPCAAATFDVPLRRRILRAAAALPALVDELESFPVTTSHGDACTDNLLVTSPDDDVVLVDFGFWGTAPVGFDLGQLVLGEIQLGRRPADTFPELEGACLPAYVQGLWDEGVDVPLGTVRRAHAVAMTIFHAVPSIPYEARDAAAAPDVLALFENRAAMARGILDLLDSTSADA